MSINNGYWSEPSSLARYFMPSGVTSVIAWNPLLISRFNSPFSIAFCVGLFHYLPLREHNSFLSRQYLNNLFCTVLSPCCAKNCAALWSVTLPFWASTIEPRTLTAYMLLIWSCSSLILLCIFINNSFEIYMPFLRICGSTSWVTYFLKRFASGLLLLKIKLYRPDSLITPIFCSPLGV